MTESKFKVGDWVRATESHNDQFTEGKTYKVKSIKNTMVYVEKDDRGSVTNGWGFNQFEPWTPFIGDPVWICNVEFGYFVKDHGDLWEISNGDTKMVHKSLVSPHVPILEKTVSATSPVRTVTRKEVVPGYYGCVTIAQGYTGEFRYRVEPNMDAEQLRSAARVLTEIADALDSNS